MLWTTYGGFFEDQMNDSLPIPRLDRMPVRINPCPIIEAIIEIRFVSSEPWRTMPGLLFGHIRERYTVSRDLPLATFPEDFRRQNPALMYLPLVQFVRSNFLIQFGPRVVSLVTSPNQYPGWQEMKTEMAWLLEQIKISGFVSEAERLGVRYFNFFSEDIFAHLHLRTFIGAKALESDEVSISTVFRQVPMTARLNVSNSVIVGGPDNPRSGSIFDVDVWIGALDFELFSNGLQRTDEAHDFEKRIFFGLLKPDFLAKLNPEYS
jgi:uncharacterized protein (TIGR04255 family)